MTRRVLGFRKAEPIWVIPSPIYNSLNQQKVLQKFTALYPINPPTLTAIYLSVLENPIVLARDLTWLKDKILIPQIQRFLQGQRCLQIGSPVTVDGLLPSPGGELPVEHFAHLFSHLLLPFAILCREPVLDIPEQVGFQYEELAWTNIFNPSEQIIVLNFPAKTDHLGYLVGKILDHFNLWIRGEKTTSLLRDLRAMARDFYWSRDKT